MSMSVLSHANQSPPHLLHCSCMCMLWMLQRSTAFTNFVLWGLSVACCVKEYTGTAVKHQGLCGFSLNVIAFFSTKHRENNSRGAYRQCLSEACLNNPLYCLFGRFQRKRFCICHRSSRSGACRVQRLRHGQAEGLRLWWETPRGWGGVQDQTQPSPAGGHQPGERHGARRDGTISRRRSRPPGLMGMGRLQSQRGVWGTLLQGLPGLPWDVQRHSLQDETSQQQSWQAGERRRCVGRVCVWCVILSLNESAVLDCISKECKGIILRSLLRCVKTWCSKMSASFLLRYYNRVTCTIGDNSGWVPPFDVPRSYRFPPSGG